MPGSVPIKIKRLFRDAKIPTYAHPGDAGADVYCYNPDLARKIVIPRGKTAMIPTGISVAIPEGYEIQVRPRSGLAAKHGITVLNSPGTIDAGFRGQVMVILINHGPRDFVVEHEERIAQLVCAPVERMNMSEVDDLDDTSRSDGGFGSTGTR